MSFLLSNGKVSAPVSVTTVTLRELFDRYFAALPSGNLEETTIATMAVHNQPITGQFAYIYLDGIWLKRSCGGEVKNVAVLVAIGVDQDGYRQILGVVEGAKEDAHSWRQFLRHLKEKCNLTLAPDFFGNTRGATKRRVYRYEDCISF